MYDEKVLKMGGREKGREMKVHYRKVLIRYKKWYDLLVNSGKLKMCTIDHKTINKIKQDYS